MRRNLLHKSGLYYKNITIVNDSTRLVSEWRTQIEASLTVINYTPRVVNYAPRVMNHAPREHSTGVTHDDCYMTFVRCLQYKPQIYLERVSIHEDVLRTSYDHS